MTTFVGRYDRQLDPKGRLALPASFRQKFESQAFLTIGENGCLEAYTPEDHDQMAKDLRDKERRREVDRNFVRTKWPRPSRCRSTPRVGSSSTAGSASSPASSSAAESR